MSQQPDSFQFTRSAGVNYAQTKPLNDRAGTRPLSGVGKGMDGEELANKARMFLEKLEQRVEILVWACRAIGLAIPGVDAALQLHHPKTPKTDQVVAYISKAMAQDAQLAKTVQVAVFRFYDAASAIGWRETPRLPDDMEALRRQVFHLSTLPADFERDRILKALFPPPQVQEMGYKGLASLSPEAQKRQEQLERNLFQSALQLQVQLTARMEVVRLVLEGLETGLQWDIPTLLSVDGRTAKVIAIALRAEPEIAQKLREYHRKFLTLKETLVKMRETGVDKDTLRPLVLPLGEIAAAFDRPPMLVTLLRGGPKRAPMPAR